MQDKVPPTSSALSDVPEWSLEVCQDSKGQIDIIWSVRVQALIVTELAAMNIKLQLEI